MAAVPLGRRLEPRVPLYVGIELAVKEQAALAAASFIWVHFAGLSGR